MSCSCCVLVAFAMFLLLIDAFVVCLIVVTFRTCINGARIALRSEVSNGIRLSYFRVRMNLRAPCSRSCAATATPCCSPGQARCF